MKRVEEKQQLSDIRCIFLDMDGTLMRDDKKLSEGNLKELLRMQEKGIRLVMATGRPKSTIPKLPEVLKFDFYISCNGADIYDQDMNLLYRKCMSAETILKLMDTFGENDFPEYFINGEMHLDRAQLDIIDQFEVPINNVNNVFAIGHHHDSLRREFETEKMPCEKICMFFRKPFDKKAVEAAAARAAHIEGVHSVSGGPVNLEFTDVSVSKAQAVTFVLDRLGLSMDQAMAFGDSGNDLDLFAASRYGIAMDNACPEVKEQAWAITKNNNEDGVGYALKLLIP